MRTWSHGQPIADPNNPQDLHVRNSAGSVVYADTIMLPPNASGTYTYEVPTSPRFSMYATMAHTMAFWNGYVDGALTVYDTDSSAVCLCPGNFLRSCYVSNRVRICVPTADRSRKFRLSHEWGHGVLALADGQAQQVADYSQDGSGHTEWSIEYQSAAITEGWANFVSADVFNDDDESDGFYWGITGSCSSTPPLEGIINIESGSGLCVVAFMENNVGSGAWPGHGTELDWLRTFWDYHTNGTSTWGGFKPSHSDLLDDMLEFDDVWGGDDDQAYDDLRQAIANSSGCEQYERMVLLAAANGADHCEHEGSNPPDCDNVVGCTDID